MKIFDMMLIIILNTPNLSSKHRHRYSSDDSFENLLYYQGGCDKKSKKEPPQIPVPLRNIQPIPTTTPKSNCPCPRMCFSLCCDCNDKAFFMGRDPGVFEEPKVPISRNTNTSPSPLPANAMPPNLPIPSPALQNKRPPVKKVLRSKQYLLRNSMLLPPIGGRRSMVDAKENIRGLISKDEDIKKILRDLVRVTMQKMTLDEKLRETQSDIGQNDDEADKEYE